MKWFLYSCLGDTLSKAHFVCLVACCLFHFVKLFVCFCKAENIVIYILIHTIQLIFSIQKLHLFFLWSCLTCKLEN